MRDDLRRTLGVQAVRVVPSIPNTSFIGLEVPNPVRETVRLKEILESKAFRESTAPLTLALGKDIGGFSPATGGNYGNSNGNYYKEW